METLNMEQIEKQFPNEWVLIGNPVMQDTKILKGEVLFHSKDKKEVCYLGKNFTNEYNKITLTFTGNLKSVRRIGVMKKL